MKSSRHISSFTITLAFICLTLIGLAFLPLLPVKLSPGQKMPSLYISYGMGSATSKIVESQVTCRLEAMLSRMSGVEQISSSSQNGYGSISVRFDKHVDIDAARFEASTLIRQLWPELPAGTSYPSISVQGATDDNDRSFLVFTINALDESQNIYHNTDKILKNGLSDIDGLRSVEIHGVDKMEWDVEYDYQQITSLGISINDIKNAINDYRANLHVGQYTITTNVSDTTFSLNEIFVKTSDNQQIPLSRLCTMSYVRVKPWSIFRVNGLNSIYMELKANDNANQLELQKKVMSRIEKLMTQMPKGYEIHTSYDATEYISEELDKIYFRSALTVAILLVFIFLTTFSWRQLIVVVSSLVCNLAIAFIAYYLLDVELQLYSLAGITISLNLMIDNTIIMSDHWRRHHNLAAILPIVAATLTTIGALSIVFFLDERLKLSLYDFAVVMIVNLLLSIFTALWLVPSIMKLLREEHSKRLTIRRLRFTVKFSRGYSRFVDFMLRHRKKTIAFFVLTFGIPLFLLPTKLEGEGFWKDCYNKTIGSEVYTQSIRPWTDVILGGTLRLFVEKVFNGSYWNNEREISLYIYATLPYGSTIDQMDYLMRRMEAYLSQFSEIKQFTCQFQPNNGFINVHFTKEAEHSSFPYMLKTNVISKGLQLGGGSWSVFGLEDQGFSNDVRESVGSYKLDMSGYNYETLCVLADSVRRHLLTYQRIKEVSINSRQRDYKDDYVEYHLTPNKEFMIEQGIPATYLFYVLPQIFVSDHTCGSVWNRGSREDIKLKTLQSSEYNIWSLINCPIEINGRQYKISQLCNFEKLQAPREIVKTNQEYNLCIQYEYIGSFMLGDKILRQTDSIYSARLPLGYKISSGQRNFYSWRQENSTQYWLLGLVLAIIFLITSILFNSLKLPFVILSIIPVSYIGLFLTFFVCGLNFDHGGFASLILLCGITVNASIYIVNEFRHFRNRIGDTRAFVKAFNVKIIPILLTILSTILGFIPFMVGNCEPFWFPMSAGTIGGLVMSIVGIVIVLPLFLLKKK